MQESTFRQLIGGMPGRLDRVAAKGMTAVIRFCVSGDDGGDYYLVIDNQACQLSTEPHEDPDLTFRMSSKTYVDMAMGRLKGPQAFFLRKVRFSGDMSLAMKMHALFPSLSAKEVSDL